MPKEFDDGHTCRIADTIWLTIVIPAYNAQKYLYACVESMNPAAYSDIEIIIVDDGSTDATSQICDLLAARYTNVKRLHRKNDGPQSARNVGCANAEGEWIWFVDSDDLISPYALAALKRVAASTNSEAIQIGYVKFSDIRQPAWPKMFGKPTQISVDDFQAGLYRGRFQHYLWSYLFRVDALRCNIADASRHGYPFRENFSLYEDVVSIEEFVRHVSSIESCSWKCYGYRQTNTSISHQRNNESSDSGIRAVRFLQRYEPDLSHATDKTCMEVSLLFTAYRIAEKGPKGDRLRHQAKEEIESRICKIGLLHLGSKRLVRYVLLECGLLDKIIDWRDRE